jgi:hypothetical protein
VGRHILKSYLRVLSRWAVKLDVVPGGWSVVVVFEFKHLNVAERARTDYSTDPSSMHLKQSINIEYVYKLKPPTWAITSVDIVSNVNKYLLELFSQIRIN